MSGIPRKAGRPKGRPALLAAMQLTLAANGWKLKLIQLETRALGPS
jgi:hypothetical protein